MPAQLPEAALALLAGLAAMVTVLLAGLGRSGPVAVAALAAYTLGRQFILGLRADSPRRLAHGRLVTTVAATAVLLASIAVLELGMTRTALRVRPAAGHRPHERVDSQPQSWRRPACWRWYRRR